MSWTAEQEQAIKARDCALLVSAAAGSGKTTVLIEKLSSLLCDPHSGVDADNIAVVTFTRDAAAQMRTRLSDKLEEKLNDAFDSGDMHLADHISEQISLVPNARISTIHSFCFRLIREHSAEAGVDPGFGIIEPSDEEVLVKRAISNVLSQRFSEHREETEELLSMFFPTQKDPSGLSEMIFDLRRKFLALPFPESRQAEIVKYYSSPLRKDDGLIYTGFREMVKRTLRTALEMSDDALRILDTCREDAGKNYEKYRDVLRRENISIADALRVTGTETAPRIEFYSLRFTAPFGIRGEGENTGSEAVKELRKKYRELCGQYVTTVEVTAKDEKEKPPAIPFSEELLAADMKVHARITALLFDVIRESLAEEKRIKKAQNKLGFSDSEQIACSLLCSHDEGRYTRTPLAEELSARFGLIMVDEFQDTTQIQELIFKMLSRGGTKDAPGSNFFAVGDIKQSIYRFRSAEPSLFMKALTGSVPYKEGNREPSHILLNRNFRSSQAIVDGVNSFFRAIMSEAAGGVDYGDDDSLVHGAKDTSCLPLRVTDVTVPHGTRSSEKTKAEAEALAERVTELLKEGAKPEEICILARNSTRFPAYTKALEEHGLISDSGSDRGVLKSGEVQNIISFLKVIDNPTLDEELCALLLSPLFMFSAEDMAQVRLKDRGRSLYADLILAADTDDELGERCRAAKDRIEDLTAHFAAEPLHECIERLYSACDAIEVYSLLPGGAERVENLRTFLRFSSSFDSIAGADLSSFLGSLSEMPKLPAEDARIPGAVTLRTIHSSKGLEYDHIILADTGHRFNLSTDTVMFDPELGVAFDINEGEKTTGELHSYTSFPAMVLRDKLTRSQKDEEMMLLYVALTRAKKSLCIMRVREEGKEDPALCLRVKQSGKNDVLVTTAMSYAEWIDTALQVTAGVEYIPFEPAAKEDKQDIPLTERQESPDPLLEERIRANLRDNYDYSFSYMPTKLTVSGIVHDRAGELTFSGRRTDSERDGGFCKPRNRAFSSTQRGTAIHSVFENLDLLKLAREGKAAVKGELERIADIIGKDSAACAGERMIGDFISSSLFRRMMKGCDEENFSRKIYREREFFVRMSDIEPDGDLSAYSSSGGFLQGIADLLFAEDDGYVLVDYKTDRGVSENILLERYALQLDLYRRSFNAILDKPVKECYIYSTSLGAVIRAEVGG